MKDLLKGNFETKEKVEAEKKVTTLEEKFEREALKRLGGSICFVSKKKIKWDTES